MDDAVDFILNNFFEANRLWCRIQTQSCTGRDKQRREKERHDLRVLVGANLVRLAHRRGVRVKPLVGPSSILLAVMASGLNGQSFAFTGYLPVDAAERKTKLRALEQLSRSAAQTQVFIETPYRNGALLEAIQAGCAPSTLLSIAVDLTLPSEQVVTLPVSDWRADRMNLHKRPAIFSLLAR